MTTDEDVTRNDVKPKATKKRTTKASRAATLMPLILEESETETAAPTEAAVSPEPAPKKTRKRSTKANTEPEEVVADVSERETPVVSDEIRSNFTLADIAHLDSQLMHSSANFYSSDDEPDFDEDDEDEEELTVFAAAQAAKQATSLGGKTASTTQTTVQDSEYGLTELSQEQQGAAGATTPGWHSVATSNSGWNQVASTNSITGTTANATTMAIQQVHANGFAPQQMSMNGMGEMNGMTDTNTMNLPSNQGFYLNPEEQDWMTSLAQDAAAHQAAQAFSSEPVPSYNPRGEEFNPGAAQSGMAAYGDASVESSEGVGQVPFNYSVYDIYQELDHSQSQTPFIKFSRSEEEFQAKLAIVNRDGRFNEENEYPLTRFEVELYYQFPELTPETGEEQTFTKHSLEWVKAVHSKKFDVFFMDTETTGMSKEPGTKPSDNHKIITLGMVPFINSRLELNDTSKMIDWVFNPGDVKIEHEAYKVHGFRNKDLVNAPYFNQFSDYFVRLIMGKVLIIHNAPFDLSFVNEELRQAGYPFEVEDICLVIDSLVLARSLYQGRASLDALSERFGVSIQRNLHGALLDSMILADVYIRLLQSLHEEWFEDANKGFRTPIMMKVDDDKVPPHSAELLAAVNSIRVQPTEEELQRHEAFCEEFNITTHFDLISHAKQIALQKIREAELAVELEASEGEESNYEEETVELDAQSNGEVRE